MRKGRVRYCSIAYVLWRVPYHIIWWAHMCCHVVFQYKYISRETQQKSNKRLFGGLCTCAHSSSFDHNNSLLSFKWRFEDIVTCHPGKDILLSCGVCLLVYMDTNILNVRLRLPFFSFPIACSWLVGWNISALVITHHVRFAFRSFDCSAEDISRTTPMNPSYPKLLLHAFQLFQPLCPRLLLSTQSNDVISPSC